MVAARTTVAVALAVALAVWLAPARASAEQALPPAPTRWVTDGVGFLSPATRARLDARLEAYERQSGHQILVWIGDSIGGQAEGGSAGFARRGGEAPPIDDWAVRTFAAWKVGRKGVDDGVVLFVLAKDRAFDLEVGYGLEERIPDARARRILDEVIAPRLQAGDRDGGIEAGIGAITAAIDGQAFTGGEVAPARTRGKGSRLPFFVIGGIFLVLLLVNPRLAMFFLYSIALGGRRDGGDGGGGGGWSGGGGRSGGGGARGGW